MGEPLTVTLAPEIADLARSLANRSGARVEELFGAWLREVEEREKVRELLGSGPYPIYTPLGLEGAAEMLQQMIDE